MKELHDKYMVDCQVLVEVFISSFNPSTSFSQYILATFQSGEEIKYLVCLLIYQGGNPKGEE